MAYIGEGPWFNPFTEQTEEVEGIWCNCYECKRESSCNWAGPEYEIFFTKAEYRVHQNERRKQYNEYKIRQAELKSIAQPKETEALEGHGRPSSVTTRFDLNTGQLASDDDRLLGNVRWETLWRASIE